MRTGESKIDAVRRDVARMTRVPLVVTAVFSVLLCAWIASGTIAGDVVSGDEDGVFTGVIRRAEVDSRGKTLRVYIDGPGEDLLVSGVQKGKELLQHVGATVRATGHVRKIRNHPGFKTWIDVSDYRIEAGPPPPRSTGPAAIDPPG